jgi:aldehyde dehydrogenase (NAD+)
MTERFGHLIGGDWVLSERQAPDINPSDTADVVGLWPEGTAADVARAVAAAREAFPDWSRSSPQARFDILDAAGTEILARRGDLGRLLSREEGKTLAEGVGEATRAGQIFKYFAGEALRAGGELLPSVRPGLTVEVTREPVGVVGLITPWNFPIAIPAWKAAPALAYGNCVVLKPAELTPACAWALADILTRAGLPKGVFNVVFGAGETVGAALVGSPEVDAVSFTGSVVVGRQIAIRCAERLAKVQLEMGGKNPLLILDDADLDVAVECAVNSAYFSTGQRCTAASRLIVTKGAHQVFVARLTERLRALVVGDALEPGTEIGPVVDQAQLSQDLDYIAIGKGEGATLAFGGERLKRAQDGYYLQPALFTDSSPHMRINREEIFGPVAAVIAVDSYEEGLAVANDTPFGLSAGVCTTSLKYAQHFRRNIQAGMAMVNLPTAGVDYHVPFGGWKGSSYGPREQGAYAREFYTVSKTSYL